MSIAEVFNWIANNSYLIGISTLGTILGTIIIFFPPQKRPFYAVKSFNLISNSISVLEDLEVKYRCWGENGEEKVDIQCLTISKIIFWNGGRKTITSQDIANKFPIQVASKENVEILGIGLYEESISNKASNISFEKFGLIINDKAQKSIFDVRSRKIDFDFMESGDAAVIVVIHTGISSEDVYLDGYVVDSAFEGKFKLKDISSYEQNNTQIIVFLKVYSLFILGSIFWILITNYFSSPNYYDFNNLDSGHFEVISAVLVSGFISSFPTVLLRSKLFSNINLRIPKNSYQIFNSEIGK